MIDAMHRPGAMTSFRSDGNSGGLWGSVELIARPTVYIDHVKIFTRIGVKKDWLGDRRDKPDGSALVSVDVTVHNTTGEVVKTDLRLRVEPHNFNGANGHERSRPLVLQPGRTTHKLVLTVPDATLWWTWDHGDPNLYTAVVGVHEDDIRQTFGIKEVLHEEETGQWYLNGRRIFLRGMLMIGYCWDGDTDLNRIALEPNIVEFGAGSIPVLETLKTFVPPDELWPPDWDTWELNGFFYNLAFGFAKVQIKDSLEEFIESYQRYEALVVKEQIEYLRQRKYRPVTSMYHYYWSDPCPIMGSGLLDYYRRPYEVYQAVKAVYAGVLISLEREASPYVIGREKLYKPGGSFRARVWVTNDHAQPIDDARVFWQILRLDTDETMCGNGLTAMLPADTAEQLDRIV